MQVFNLLNVVYQNVHAEKRKQEPYGSVSVETAVGPDMLNTQRLHPSMVLGREVRIKGKINGTSNEAGTKIRDK